ncbi:Tetratricopeptide TPR_2 repeat protein [Beutenbergia cavernae DSM 12333]|uniref:Tetratricopeptide TPR_2 repeat protein n=1 Tax=Beutenbergia cavernae (strain ATCC BAA-8 / DSM 12333 / CCUG 43141 / JCM 11478 / NBRC 16432 / NCIMB 13614 / HKI 0122) TaxID=471853 RepID=C5BWI7_BEUC1|nr:hypothetical protein [Beutenbergia cavernae]ACQ78645.1 Tetratricopeptide TPR_2 repeat protein [Beutenbergia cavernae DSM 12333]
MPTTPYPFDLGTHTRRTSTSSPEAAQWFDRGLVWSYAFHHEEAVRCFERALRADPRFALAHWGIAYAIGPNYNLAFDLYPPEDLPGMLARAAAELARARELADGAPEVERALIEALSTRFPTDPAADFAAYNRAYATAMARAAALHPDDLDVIALHADALLNVTPWKLWSVATGEPAEGASTLEAKALLEDALARPGAMTHPGLLHLYVHLMEMSPTPELALPAADALRHLVPDAGHLLHMPTHIDVLVGDYESVIAGNTAAIEADERWVAASAASGDEAPFYALYRAHDRHFRIYGAMFAGRFEIARATAEDLEESVARELVRDPGMADFVEGFAGMRLHVLVRFGRWDELTAHPLPADPDLYCVTTALTHYARGVAFAALGRVAEAEGERASFVAASARVPESRYLFNNTCRDILAVASAMLDGEIAYRRGHIEEAFAHLRRAVDLDDTLPYDEPWGWMQPARHALGALLLEQGRVDEAAAVYAADLGLDATLGRACRHPRNVWSLHGYHECLSRMAGTDPDPDRVQAATDAGRQLALATARTDVPIEASCFCRTGT